MAGRSGMSRSGSGASTSSPDSSRWRGGQAPPKPWPPGADGRAGDDSGPAVVVEVAEPGDASPVVGGGDGGGQVVLTPPLRAGDHEPHVWAGSGNGVERPHQPGEVLAGLGRPEGDDVAVVA